MTTFMNKTIITLKHSSYKFWVDITLFSKILKTCQVFKLWYNIIQSHIKEYYMTILKERLANHLALLQRSRAFPNLQSSNCNSYDNETIHCLVWQCVQPARRNSVKTLQLAKRVGNVDFRSTSHRLCFFFIT